MPDTSPKTSQDARAVRVSAEERPSGDHPALRKIARTVIAIAERQIAEDTDDIESDVPVHPDSERSGHD